MKDYEEPHFDDEQTILTARRVVPLEKIEAKARHRRQWFLGGAFAIAMMLGAASALVASYLKLRNVPQTTTELAVEPEVEAEPVAVVESTPAPTPEETPVTPKKETLGWGKNSDPAYRGRWRHFTPPRPASSLSA